VCSSKNVSARDSWRHWGAVGDSGRQQEAPSVGMGQKDILDFA